MIDKFLHWIKNNVLTRTVIILLLIAATTCVYAENTAAHTKKVNTHIKHAKKTLRHSIVKNKHHKVGRKYLVNKNSQPTNSLTLSAIPHYALLDPKIAAIPDTSTSGEEKLVHFVSETVASLKYSVYKLGGTRIDITRGIYIVDCSTYIDHILKIIYPNAYASFVNWSGSEKPTTHDYYDFISDLDDKPKHYWSSVDEVEQLRAGDVLVFRYKNNSGNETGGHVMIVMDKPGHDGDIYWVKVADSAAMGHSQDTRQNRVSGVGIGTLLLKVNPKTYQPAAFAWTMNSHWQRNVNFAMARPLIAS